MQKAIENVKSLLGEKSAILGQRWFERIDKINKSNRVFQRIASTKDKEQIVDSLAEIRFALIFAGLGFDVEFEPTGNQGPDLLVRRDNVQVVVEVKRFRKTNPDLPILNLDDEDLTLPEYGNVPRDVRRAFNKILDKFHQVEYQKGIIAIWNDDEELEEVETDTAVYNIRDDAKKGLLMMPEGLLFVLYGSKWIGNKQLHCFPFQSLEQHCFPFQSLEQPFEIWKTELEQATVFEHIERTLANA